MSDGLNEVQQRLYTAHHGFAALMKLLSSNDGVQVASEDMYCLIQPLVAEVDAALDELEHLPH